MDQVEGVWKNFTFKWIETKEDEERVLEHLKHNFCHDETVASIIGERDGIDSFEDYRQFYEWVFDRKDKMSFYAYDNTTKEVAGVRITFHHDKNVSFDHFDFKSQKMKVLLQVIAEVDGLAKPFEKFGIDHYANFITASTDRRYRKQGLVSEMYKRSLALLKERKYPMCKSIFTSPWTRKATENLNFIHIARVNFGDMKGEQGQQLMPNAKEDDFATFGYILL